MRTGSAKFKKNSKSIPSPIPVPHTKFQSNLSNATQNIARKPLKMAAIMDFRPFWKIFRSPNRSQYGRSPKISLPWKFRDDRSSGSIFGFFARQPSWIGGFAQIFRNSHPAHSLRHPARTLKSKILARSEYRFGRGNRPQKKGCRLVAPLWIN